MFILLGEVFSEVESLSVRIPRLLPCLLSPAVCSTQCCRLYTFWRSQRFSLSTAAAVGSCGVSGDVERGYAKAVVGSLAGGGTLGLLIPPSLSLLIFGALTETSIGQLFVVGVVPGIMVSALFMIYILFLCLRQQESPPVRMRTFHFGSVAGMVIWPILL